MGSVIELNTQGIISTKDGRKFTRLVGGFGENMPVITVKQIAELMNYDNSIVTRTINRNAEHFVEGVDIIDLKAAIVQRDNEFLTTIGYTQNAFNASRNIYILSHQGFLIYLQIADIKDDYSDFVEKYFGSNDLKMATMRYEHCFGNIIHKYFSGVCNFKSQYNCGKYFIDFYDEDLKLALEYDEEHHINNTIQDRVRQNTIENILGCKFIRVKKGEEIQGVNNIIKYISNREVLNG